MLARRCAPLRAVLLAFCAAVLVPMGGLAQEAPAKVRFATIGVLGTLHSSYVIARDRGLFAAQGLDVEFVPLDATPIALAALAAGSVQFSFAGPNIADAVVAGVPIVVIYASVNVPVSEVCVQRSVASARDLIGKTLATTNRGSAPDVTLRIWLDRQGIDERQLTIRNIDAGIPAIVAAVEAGNAHGFALNPPRCSQYSQSGFHVLSDPAGPAIRFFGGGIAVNRDYLAASRNTVRRFVTAVLQGRRLFETDKELAIATVKAGDRLSDQATAESVWDFFKARLADPPLVSDEAMHAAVKHSLNPQTRDLGPALVGRMYDNSVVEEVTGR
jgi:NitT/TauT family transport system substrate-binding protein